VCITKSNIYYNKKEDRYKPIYNIKARSIIMFTQLPILDTSANIVTPQPDESSAKSQTPFIPGLSGIQTGSSSTMNMDDLDTLLETEKQFNKTEPWNKLDKTVKLQKLHCYAEKYGKDKGLPVKEVKNLKHFFVNCLEKGKLLKTKDVTYNKEERELIAIPALYFNADKHNFTLRILDTKRVSTLKSLTPKRVVEKNKNDEKNNNVEEN